ncbi:MAG TPA: outer membrane beta-barrel protein [Chitinophagaceae bacterium]|nr:outer membrane beta-barrel protein [Chitinophagaceae bacterium]
MDENLHYIDRLFRDAIDDYEEIPSLKAWKTISDRLDTQRAKKGRDYNWLKTTSSFLLLILLGIEIHDVQTKMVGDKFSILEANIYKNSGPVNMGIRPNDILKKSEKNKPDKLVSSVTNEKWERDPVEQRVGVKGIMYGGFSPNGLSESANTVLTKSGPLDSGTFISLLENKNIPAIVLPEKKIANENRPGNNASSRLSVIVFFSPDFPFYCLQHDPHDISGNDIKNGEKPDLSSTTGVLLDYSLGDHWSLQPGMSYSNAIILIDPKTIYAEKDNTGSVKYRYNASSGYGYVLPSFSNSPSVGDSLYAYSATHTLRYLNIPIAMRYRVQKGKFNFFASAGISTNILLQGIIETLVQDNSNNEIEVMNHLHGLKNIYFSGLFNIGAEYRLNKNFSLMVAPVRRFALNSINKNVSVKSYPNSFGIAAGIRMRL